MSSFSLPQALVVPCKYRGNDGQLNLFTHLFIEHLCFYDVPGTGDTVTYKIKFLRTKNISSQVVIISIDENRGEEVREACLKKTKKTGQIRQ